MNQQQFFTKVLKTLDKLHIPYMISGSVGAMLYGEPRMTNDIDIIVEMEIKKVQDFLSYFREDKYYHPSLEFIEDAIIRKSQFNIIHLESGSKVDMIIRKETAFARLEFSRKKAIAFTEKFKAFTASPEDIILSKMEYYNLSKSERHITDIVSILIISGNEIDNNYLQDWIEKLNYQDIWKIIQKRLKKPATS